MISPKNILVATDFSEASDAALLYGRSLAGAFGATLHVLHVTQDVYLQSLGSEAFVPSVPSLQQQVDEAARKQLANLVIDSDGSGPCTRTVIRSAYSPAQAIVLYAKNENIDLIVIGTHGLGAIGHLLMGSVAERVVRTAPCPVLTVRHPEHEFIVPDTLATVTHA
jgi:nucleotide-binding universal stress UspA family protein